MSIKQKILTGFGILLLAIGIAGVLTLRQVGQLERAVDVILRENYQSVIICQNVNESLARLDRALLLALAGQAVAPEVIEAETARIRGEWQAELHNITLPTEGVRAGKVAKLLTDYFASLKPVNDPAVAAEARLTGYRQTVYPLFVELKKEIGGVQMLNQQNMIDAKNLAGREADQLYKRGIVLLFGCVFFVLMFSLLLNHWVRRPLQKLISMTNEIANGNLSLALDSRANDEIGQLSRSFNAMAIALRNARSQLLGRLSRSEKMNKDVFSELPTPIVVFDVRTERIELATQSARRYFGLEEGKFLNQFPEWLTEIFKRVRQNGVISIASKNDGVIQQFIDGKEFFFQPTGVPLPSGVPLEELTGVVVIFKDVTMAHEQQELKKSVISTVSHQLKTPLTSLQMSIYLLLEEKCGVLNADQLDLVLAMRDDSQRLTDIIGDLLDLNKISGSVPLVTESCAPNALLSAAKERFAAECQEQSISLELECDPLSPVVQAALTRIDYVFDNLIGNAIRFTPPGGKIRLSAKPVKHGVEFSVADTGRGMNKEVLKHLFEPFYRGPGQDSASGVGLGLSIVKAIVTAHGGNIKVASEENSGTVFSFTLPLTKGAKK